MRWLPKNPRRARPEADLEATATRIWDTLAGLTGALNAHDTLAGRLVMLSYTAAEHASTLETLAAENRPEIRTRTRWGRWNARDPVALPAELSFDAARPGPRKAWQRLDRELRALFAALDADDGDYRTDAIALRRFADAALRLAGELPGGASCSFCGRPRDTARLLIASGNTCICDACVAICGELVTRFESEP